MLQNILAKIKGVSKEEWMLVSILVLVALLSFGLGRLSVIYGGGGGIEIVYPESTQNAAVLLASETDQAPELPPPPEGGGGYVASKTGAKYHLPWCSGARSIKEENKIYFQTKEEAESAGYTPAGNCKGI